jgi:hypothetical protein
MSTEMKLDPLFGSDFRNVLGDALRARRGLARRLSRLTRMPSRHRGRRELVHVLRGSSGAAFKSGLGRGDDIARSAHLVAELDVQAVLPTVRVPTLVVQHADNVGIPPAKGKYIAEHIPDAKYVELPGRNMYHGVEPWRASFQEIAEFVTGQQAEVPGDRVLATVLFTDIVDSTRRAVEIGDRDSHALLDAHDAVVGAQLSRFRGREVNTSGDGFLAMFDGPQRAIRCAMAIREAVSWVSSPLRLR